MIVKWHAHTNQLMARGVHGTTSFSVIFDLLSPHIQDLLWSFKDISKIRAFFGKLLACIHVSTRE